MQEPDSKLIIGATETKGAATLLKEMELKTVLAEVTAGGGCSCTSLQQPPAFDTEFPSDFAVSGAMRCCDWQQLRL
jgi:hypothetical protein